MKEIDGGVNGNELTKEQAEALRAAAGHFVHQVGDFIRGFIDSF